MTSSISRAGTAADPIEIRQDTDSLAPTSVEITMPTPIASWKQSTSRPRRLAGASSATYIGTVWVAPPTANPSTTRPRASISGAGAAALARVPTTKTAQTMRMVRLRPRRSLRKLHERAPMTAPSRMLAAMTCSMPLPVSNSLLICRRAPEMMPVS